MGVPHPNDVPGSVAKDQTSPPSEVVRTSSIPHPCIAQLDGEKRVTAPKRAEANTSWVARSVGTPRSNCGRSKPSCDQLCPPSVLRRILTQLEAGETLFADARASTAHTVPANERA